MAYPIPILTYHQVTPNPHPAFARYTVTDRLFAAHMRLLKRLCYQTITLDMLLQSRASGCMLPSRAVVVTFDDGLQECLEHATPVLHTLGYTAYFYLVAGLMGQQSTWLQAECGTTFPLASWEMARAIERNGMICGVHTMTHPRLAALDAASCRAELRDSRAAIEEQLGRPIQHLTYPFGSFSSETVAIASELGFRSACTTAKGRTTANDHPLMLRRVSVYGHENLVDFVARVRTARSVRELIQDARRRVIVSRKSSGQVGAL